MKHDKITLSFSGNENQLKILAEMCKKWQDMDNKNTITWKGHPSSWEITKEYSYINSIDCSNMKLKKVTIPEGCKEFTCNFNCLSELFVPSTCKSISCIGNKLTKLNISDGVERVICNNNKLTELKIPSSCKILGCNYNKLTELNIPQNCKSVDCSGNCFNTLTIPTGCKTTYCYDNEKLTELIVSEGNYESIVFSRNKNLTQVDLPEKSSCDYLDLSCNKLFQLTIPENYKNVFCYNNKLTQVNIPKGCEMISCFSNELDELIIPEGCKTVYCRNNKLNKLEVPNNCRYGDYSDDNCMNLISHDGNKKLYQTLKF